MNNHLLMHLRSVQPAKGFWWVFVLYCIIVLDVQEVLSKERRMSLYPKIFSDASQSSFVKIVSFANGKKVWFQKSLDPTGSGIPRLLLLTDDGLTAQYGSWIQHMKLDGTVLWRRECEGGLFLQYHQGEYFYRSSSLSFSSIDKNNKPILSDFYVFSSSPSGWFPFILPRSAHSYIVQTANRGEEGSPDSSGEQDNTNIVSMDNGVTQWQQTIPGISLPALCTSDASKLLVIGSDMQVSFISIADGTIQGAVRMPCRQVHAASLDKKNHLISAVTLDNGQYALCCMGISDAKTNRWKWQFDLHSREPKPFVQPPVIGGDDRVYFIDADTLFAFDHGKEIWVVPLFPATDFQFVTCLADNSTVVVSGSLLMLVDAKGHERFRIFLAPGEEITTPPVIDTEGRIYCATSYGIYCYN